MSKFSYSKVDCFKSCPYKYQLRYIEQLETLPNYDASNPLHLGTCMHTGIERGVNDGIAQYHAHYPIIDDLQVHEAMKLEHLIPLAQAAIPAGGMFEVKIETDEFKGFIDMLVPKGDNVFDLYDFKYSNNGERYMQSVQLHVYKHFYELTHPGHKIDKLFYVFIPKTQIRQKKTEDLYQFRKRLQSELDKMEVMVEEVEFDFQKVRKYLDAVETIKAASEFPKNCTKLCDWCEYQQYCKEGDTTMIKMPKIERRTIKANPKKRIWLFGKPMSGKTFFVNNFPEPLMLNTDDNTDLVTATVLTIKDQVSYTGNVKNFTSAWEYFIQAVDMLEREQTNPERPKTVIVDLLDHVFMHCRDYVLGKNKIEHETDSGYGKGFALVRTPFIQQIKRLLMLDYENIILISYEDDASAVTKRDGSNTTRFKTTIPDAVANQLAGLVKVIARVHMVNGERKLSFPQDSLMFGGVRLPFSKPTIPLDYDAFIQAYDEALAKVSAKAADAPQTASEPAEAPTPAETADEPVQATSRRRVVK